MRVEFSEEALAEPNAHRHLTAIFWRMVDGYHRWFVRNPDVILQSAWFRNEGADNQRQIQEQLNYTERHVAGLRVVVARQKQLASDCWTLTPREAEHLLGQPLHILVENADSDGTFLRIVLLRFGEKSVRRKMGEDGFAALKQTWTTAAGDGRFFVVQHGGGGTIGRMIELLVEQHQHAPPRATVVLDSDRTHPTSGLGGTAHTAQQACANCSRDENGSPRYYPQWSLEPFVLERREVENYIPLPALEKFVGKGKNPAVQALRRLTREQRNFYDMKEGLRSSLERDENGAAPLRPASWVWTNGGQKDLYTGAQAGLDDANLQTLSDGFGRHVWKAFKDPQIHAAQLREEAGEEFERLVEHVLSHL